MSDKTIHPRERDLYRERDELRTKNYQLRQEVLQLSAQYSEREAELRAENERLRSEVARAFAKRDDAQTEIERLRAEIELRTNIMDELAWAHAPCDCEQHQGWLTFDRPKE
jgi:predicted  nucleic acid-binding Zn-ribbon protein